MEENFVAILFKEISINTDTYLFVPIHVIEGKYTEDAKIFVDNLENAYYDIEEAHIGLSNRTEYFGFPTPLEKIKQYFNTTDSTEALKKYFETICENFYLGVVDKNNSELEIISIPLSNVRDMVNNSDSKNDIDGQLEDEQSKITARCYFTEEAIENMLKMETIEEVRAYLNRVSEYMKEVNKIVEDMQQSQAVASNNVPITRQNNVFDVVDMYDYTISKVINQDEAVRKILMTFLMNNISVNSQTLKDVQPTRTLITGPTGVGKTLILETIIEYLDKYTNYNIPMVKVPTSQLTAAGYVGMNLEDILEELVSKVTITSDIGEKIKYAENNGVVFLDEIDKKGSKDNGDVSGRSVLNSLLQFLDGANYQIFASSKYLMNSNRTPSYFNTKYLNVFASGAFTHVKDELNQKRIGFNCGDTKIIQRLNVSDYIEKGEMPSEFMGRFHQIVNLNPLGVNDLKDILNKSLASPILVEKQKLELIGLNLNWDQTFIEEVAKKAYNLKLGARSLKTIIEESLFEAKWQALFNGKETSVLVTRETVENPKQYRII